MTIIFSRAKNPKKKKFWKMCSRNVLCQNKHSLKIDTTINKIKDTKYLRMLFDNNVTKVFIRSITKSL